jgi:hypothetical protein
LTVIYTGDKLFLVSSPLNESENASSALKGLYMDIRTYFRRVALASVALMLVVATACDNSEEPVPPARIIVVSGDGQFSKKGTDVPEPLVVKVQYPDLSDAGEVAVRFRSTEGGGSVSRTTDFTDGRGLASTGYTLGPASGVNRIRAEIVQDDTKYVEFNATAGEFFCPEENPTFERKFNSVGTGVEPDLFLFTRESTVNQSGNATIAGVVRIVLEPLPRPRPFTSYEEQFGRIVVRDAVFAHSGDFYISWMDIFPEIMKIKPNKTTQYFSRMETYLGGEITTSVAGVLAGCDEYGPFMVGCRDTVMRFEEALYSGVPGDMANYDAVAVDVYPQNTYYEDIYFIDLSDNTLRRLPLDSLVAAGPTEVVAQLTSDEASGTRGMVCNNDGTIYMLVDNDDDRKAILSVTPAGVENEVFDFFTRSTDTEAEAGIQRDLAIWVRPSGNPMLYTVDTLNDMLLRYDVYMGQLVELFPDTLSGYDPESISKSGVWGERVGLVVLP